MQSKLTFPLNMMKMVSKSGVEMIDSTTSVPAYITSQRRNVRAPNGSWPDKIREPLLVTEEKNKYSPHEFPKFDW